MCGEALLKETTSLFPLFIDDLCLLSRRRKTSSDQKIKSNKSTQHSSIIWELFKMEVTDILERALSSQFKALSTSFWLFIDIQNLGVRLPNLIRLAFQTAHPYYPSYLSGTTQGNQNQSSLLLFFCLLQMPT